MKDVIIWRKLGEGYTGSRCCFFATFCKSVNTFNVLTKLVIYQQYLRPLIDVLAQFLWSYLQFFLTCTLHFPNMMNSGFTTW